MKVIVLGSGVIGLTSAWYLSQAGYEVTVVDRQSSSAKETSYANAGQISYGYSSPWAAPGIPSKAIRWLFEEHAPLKIKPSLSPHLMSWAQSMLMNCQIEKYRTNKSRMLSIANRSREALAKLNNQHNLNYQGRRQGTLQIFRKAEQLNAIEKDIKLLTESGTKHQLLDVEQCIKQEPGLHSVSSKLVGGLYLPDDETGDCYLFCQQLQTLAEKAGVNFLFDTDIFHLIEENNKVVAVETSAGRLEAERYVVALGSYSKALLDPLNVRLPIYPVKGYSLTLPVISDEHAPSSTIMDETYKVALTRFDKRIRIAGMAELAGYDTTLSAKRLATLNHVVKDLFPHGVDMSRAEYWSGFRPMTPDGTPIIGPTRLNNLYTNTGHGTLGWTMACGSAEILTESMTSNRESSQPELSISRYG